MSVVVFVFGVLVGLSIRELIEKFKNMKSLEVENKDPSEDRWTPKNSTKWVMEADKRCGECLNPLSHSEYRARFCGYCGRSTVPYSFLRERKIWYGGKWLRQIQCNSANYVLSKMKLLPTESVRDDNILLWESSKYCGNKRVDKLTVEK